MSLRTAEPPVILELTGRRWSRRLNSSSLLSRAWRDVSSRVAEIGRLGNAASRLTSLALDDPALHRQLVNGARKRSPQRKKRGGHLLVRVRQFEPNHPTGLHVRDHHSGRSPYRNPCGSRQLSWSADGCRGNVVHTFATRRMCRVMARRAAHGSERRSRKLAKG